VFIDGVGVRCRVGVGMASIGWVRVVGYGGYGGGPDMRWFDWRH